MDDDDQKKLEATQRLLHEVENKIDYAIFLREQRRNELRRKKDESFCIIS